MKTGLYIKLKNREEIGENIRNYIEIETKKREDKRMNKIEFLKEKKALNEEKTKNILKMKLKKWRKKQ